MTAATQSSVKPIYKVGETEIELILATTTVSGYTTTVDISTYGGKKVRGVLGFVHTTEDSVIAQEQPTTSVSGTTLTITVGGSAVTGKRVYKIFIA